MPGFNFKLSRLTNKFKQLVELKFKLCLACKRCFELGLFFNWYNTSLVSIPNSSFKPYLQLDNIFFIYVWLVSEGDGIKIKCTWNYSCLISIGVHLMGFASINFVKHLFNWDSSVLTFKHLFKRGLPVLTFKPLLKGTYQF